MPSLVSAVPKYRKHRASGQALVTLNGVDHYLGPHNSKASKLQYDLLIGQWLQSNRSPLFGVPEDEKLLSIVELISLYRSYCEKYYRKPDGTPTATIDTIRAIMKLLRKRYGNTPVSEFGPLALKDFIKSMIDADKSRTYCNMALAKIKQMFKWAVGEELVDSSVFQRLNAVAGQRAGRSDARETKAVAPVDDATVEATLPYLPALVSAMVKVQRLTGMRPGEVCSMKNSELEPLDDLLVYRPRTHKTTHKGKSRTILIGPQARLALAPYLGHGDFVFSPKHSVEIEMKKRGVKRSTPRTAGECYTKDSYRRAVVRACDEAKIERWSPNQLRHAMGTQVREAEQSIEAAAAVLGHSNISTTEVYAERNMKLAADIVRKIG